MTTGRPSKISPTARETIAQQLARGATSAEAAQAAGISVRTLTNWLARGRVANAKRRAGTKLTAAERPYLQLLDQITAAERELDRRTVEAIDRYVSAGVDFQTAAAAGGVSFAQLERLEARAELIRDRRNAGERIGGEERVYLALSDGPAQAQARLKVQALACIHKAALNGNWRAAAWWLERMFPDEFASPNLRARGVGAGRPRGATSAPDRPSTSDPPPPRIRLSRAS